LAQAFRLKPFGRKVQGRQKEQPRSFLGPGQIMARLSAPLLPLLLAAGVLGTPDAPATPVQRLRGALNSTSETPWRAEANLTDPGDVEGQPFHCCKGHKDDATLCTYGSSEHYRYCQDKVPNSGCAWRGAWNVGSHIQRCCAQVDVGTAWFLGGCH